MTTLEKIIKGSYLLIINPRLFSKYLASHLKRLMPKWRHFRPSIRSKNISGVLFDFDFNYLGYKTLYIKQMYFDCYEIATVEAIKKMLRPGDIFIDVGANIGYLTAIGAGLVGKAGQVHSFEPVSESFQRLKKIAEMNPGYKIIVNNCALGEKSGMIKMDFIKPPYSSGSTMVPGMLNDRMPRENIEVSVIRLDDYIKKNILKKITLIKIDVEGFEFPVLKGLENYFKETDYKPVIICEIAPSAYHFLGHTSEQLLEYMRKYEYYPFNIMYPNLRIGIADFKDGVEVIFKTLK